jgi:hypothetical protein
MITKQNPEVAMNLIHYQKASGQVEEKILPKEPSDWNVQRFRRLDDLLKFLTRPLLLSRTMALLILSDEDEVKQLNDTGVFTPDMVTLVIDLGEGKSVFSKSHLLSPRITLRGPQRPDVIHRVLLSMIKNHLYTDDYQACKNDCRVPVGQDG